MTARCERPLPLRKVLDYLAGDLAAEEDARVEEHYFSCSDCARRLEETRALIDGIVSVFRQGRLSSVISHDALERLGADGLKLREYTLEAGNPVSCTAGPDDDLVVVHLRMPPALRKPLVMSVTMDDLDGGTGLDREVDVAVDDEHGEVVLAFAGDDVRSYPASRWTMFLAPRGAAGSERIGPYVMNHTPWDRLKDPA